MIKHIQPVSAPSENDLLAQAYPQIKRDFGALVEPFTLHAPAPRLMAGIWMATRETELVGIVRREIKEAVAVAVSTLNQCPYCVDAHTMMLHATSAHSAATAIGQVKGIEFQDPAIEQIVAWAKATRSPNDPLLKKPPFSRSETPEIIGTAVVFHYINRMAQIFLDETPLPSNRGWLKGTLKRMAGWYFSLAVRRQKTAGLSLALLPEAELPNDLSWAAASPVIASAFARWTAVVETAGQDVLPANVCAVVREHITTWNGKDPGLSRNWVEKVVDGLDESEKPAARLALLTALAPYQINNNIIAAFRTQQPGDDKLIAATAWASLTAARRIGTWL